MREIKFRAWDTGSETMHSWEEIKNLFYEHVEHEKVIVEQYTGLTDKNGVEIYEGDIIKDGKSIGQIIYESRYCLFSINWVKNSDHWNDYIHNRTKSMEVVGNIYENQELLEAAKC